MIKRFYVTDLDGTLLNSQGQLSEYSVAVLNELINKGALISFATARSLDDFCEIMRDVKVQLPVITFNGGYISNVITRRHYNRNYIPDMLTQAIYKLLSEEVGVLVSYNHDDGDCLSYDRLASKGMADYVATKEMTLNKPLKTFERFAFKDVMAFTVIDEMKKILLLKDRLIMNFAGELKIEAWQDMYYKSWYWLSVHTRDATKGKALKKLKELVDKPFDKLVVFGDQMNDLEMFKEADQAFAVLNAVDPIKAIAHHVIGHHNQDSVVKKF